MQRSWSRKSYLFVGNAQDSYGNFRDTSSFPICEPSGGQRDSSASRSHRESVEIRLVKTGQHKIRNRETLESVVAGITIFGR
jgi:hypothetical protein